MTQLTFQINRPEDVVLMLQIAQRLGIKHNQSQVQKPKKVLKRKKPDQAAVFLQMEKLRLEFLEKYRIPVDVDINQIIDQMNEL